VPQPPVKARNVHLVQAARIWFRNIVHSISVAACVPYVLEAIWKRDEITDMDCPLTYRMDCL
jgi:hypothetical protein